MIAAVGDGNHDTALFEASDVSVAFEKDITEIADISICTGDILSLPLVYKICTETEKMLIITFTYH